jgi:glucose/arabinose dehydrogenase
MDVWHGLVSLRRSKTAGVCIVAGVSLISTTIGMQVATAAPPSGFVDEVVATVGAPTALASLPDGRMLVTTQQGTLRVIDDDQLVSGAALSITDKVCAENERGLLGVTADPAFSTNNYVYLFYTAKKPEGGCVNRVSRFTMAGNTVTPSSESILLDGLQTPASNHNGGDVQFGKDGHLYVSVGDGAQGSRARDLSYLNGKILRITKTGQIPADNPFMGSDSARCSGNGQTNAGKKCQEIFASGLRNPFRMAFDPNASGTRFYINDVGQNSYEEIDLGSKGADYGWNVREGECSAANASTCGVSPAGMTDPVHAYGRDGGCSSITGGAFVPGDVWGAAYKGAYLFSDYVCGKVFVLRGTQSSTFMSGLGGSSAVHMVFAPYENTQALYYTSYANGGQIHRVRSTGGTAGTTTTTTTAPASTTTSTTSTSVPTDGVTITSPTPGKTYGVGEVVTLTATSEDELDDSAFEWSTQLRHNTHTHPLMPATKGKSTTFAYPKPEDLPAAANSDVLATLRVTGADGEVTTVTRTIAPKKVSLTFASTPAGVTVTLQGVETKTPATVTSWVGHTFTVSAPPTFGGSSFSAWSQGGSVTQTITTPAAAKTYSVTYGGNPAATTSTVRPGVTTSSTSVPPVTIPAPTSTSTKPAAVFTTLPLIELRSADATTTSTTNTTNTSVRPTTTSSTSMVSTTSTTSAVGGQGVTTTAPPRPATTIPPVKVTPVTVAGDEKGDFVETPAFDEVDEERADELARTGAAVVWQLAAGFLLVAIGLVILRIQHKTAGRR